MVTFSVSPGRILPSCIESPSTWMVYGWPTLCLSSCNIPDLGHGYDPRALLRGDGSFHLLKDDGGSVMPLSAAKNFRSRSSSPSFPQHLHRPDRNGTTPSENPFRHVTIDREILRQCLAQAEDRIAIGERLIARQRAIVHEL